MSRHRGPRHGEDAFDLGYAQLSIASDESACFILRILGWWCSSGQSNIAASDGYQAKQRDTKGGLERPSHTFHLSDHGPGHL
jgi:hypothetical protein